MKVRNAVHNYEASFGPVAHPIHRRLPTEVKEQVRGLTASGTAARIVVSTMRMESQQTIIAKDVYNIRAKIRKENLAGKTPIESLIAILKESDYVFNYRTDNIGRITHFFSLHILRVLNFSIVILMFFFLTALIKPISLSFHY